MSPESGLSWYVTTILPDGRLLFAKGSRRQIHNLEVTGRNVTDCINEALASLMCATAFMKAAC